METFDSFNQRGKKTITDSVTRAIIEYGDDGLSGLDQSNAQYKNMFDTMCEIEARIMNVDDDAHVDWHSMNLFYLYCEILTYNTSDYFDIDQFQADAKEEIQSIESVHCVRYQGELEICIDSTNE